MDPADLGWRTAVQPYFHDEIALRTLIHGLVHATQMALLGMDRYTDLYVRGFAKSRSRIGTLEAQPSS